MTDDQKYETLMRRLGDPGTDLAALAADAQEWVRNNPTWDRHQPYGTLRMYQGRLLVKIKAQYSSDETWKFVDAVDDGYSNRPSVSLSFLEEESTLVFMPHGKRYEDWEGDTWCEGRPGWFVLAPTVAAAEAKVEEFETVFGHTFEDLRARFGPLTELSPE